VCRSHRLRLGEAVNGLRASVDRRIRVLIARRRLEEHAATLVERATGTRPGVHRFVADRLALLTAGVPPARWADAHGLARRAANVYSDTSIVLHSNRAFGDVPEPLVREWEQVVADVQEMLGQPAATRPPTAVSAPSRPWPARS
jgi:hypothetical protein